MKELNFFGSTGVFLVGYKTDLLFTDVTKIGRFTILEINGGLAGATDAMKRKGLFSQNLTYTLQDFKDFAQAHNLKLQIADNNAATTVVDYTDYSGMGSIVL